jgi:Delta3-Delta2-enoyl-CoA isomerase
MTGGINRQKLIRGEKIHIERSVKGFIVSSAIPGFFSAGIDLSLFVGEIDNFLSFWMSLRKMFLRIYESKLVSIACISGNMFFSPISFLKRSGHAPGGGTILALACQYRLMLNGKSMIGLNEVNLLCIHMRFGNRLLGGRWHTRSSLAV